MTCRFITTLLIGVTLSLPSLTRAQPQPLAKPIPLADFYKLPVLGQPMLSPDGKLLAMLAPSTANDGRITLAVADVKTPTKMMVVAHLRDADVRRFSWVASARLVFDVVDFQAALGEQSGSGLYAVNADGSDFRWLLARSQTDTNESNFARRPLSMAHEWTGTPGDGSGDVLIQRYEWQPGARYTTVPLRLNTVTRGVRSYTLGAVPKEVMAWVTDASSATEPRALMARDEKDAVLYWRDRTSGAWSELARFNMFTGGKGYMELAGLDADGKLYVRAIQDNPERTYALYRYDVANKRLDGEPLVALKGFDFTGSLIFDAGTRRLLGASYVADAPGVAWFDAGMQQMQQKIDKQLPATVNRIVCDHCEKADQVVVWAESDRQPPVYFLYDRASDKLNLIGASRPWIDSRQAAEVDFVRITARDGSEVPIYVTKPKGQGPWPTVMLVHGGPYVRGGEWGWHRDAQFLASRGYLVVEPEFRGSTGYGDKHFRAGWKQWGLAMQDDVTDATQWAIAKGLADPKRIVIAGASYGGYATMMGLVREPELYRAGINWVGVTDINLIYDVRWSDGKGSDWQKYGMPQMVGDQQKDAAQLEATSPLRQAARITKPVLMAYGGADVRVPLPHGTEMREALKRAGKVQVEWVEYPSEGHGWMQMENNIDFWSRVERFLAQNLK